MYLSVCRLSLACALLLDHDVGLNSGHVNLHLQITLSHFHSEFIFTYQYQEAVTALVFNRNK
jgi:hypothetical protein